MPTFAYNCGPFYTMKNPTLANFLPEYRKWAKANLKPATLTEYDRLLEKQILPAFGSKRLTSLTTRTVEAWHLKSRASAPVQANRALAVLSGVLQRAAAWGCLPANPARGVRRAREEKRERQLTPDEIDRIRAALDEFAPVERAFVLTVLYTGARPGELLSASEEMFTGTTLELPDSKTGRRTIYLPEPAQEAVRAALTGTGAIFPGVEPTTLWRKLRRRTGIHDARLYDLRHTFASRGLEAGLTLLEIGRLLGHNNPQTTSRYAHLSREHGLESAGKVAGAIG